MEPLKESSKRVRRAAMCFRPCAEGPVASPANVLASPPARPLDRFEMRGPAEAAAARPPQVRSAGEVPQAIEPHLDDYYRRRHEDFMRRNPGRPPPSYYLDYGQKYLRRFTKETKRHLSPEGKAWLERTGLLLRQAMENRRASDPAAYAQLERDDPAFQRFAYSTHAPAYLDGGVLELSAHDLKHIAATPDPQDVLTDDGLQQVFAVAREVDPDDLRDILHASLQDAVTRLEDLIDGEEVAWT